MSNQEIQMAELKKDIQYIKVGLDEHQKLNKEEFEDVKSIMKTWMEGADEKYASKLTEKIVYTMVGVVLTSVLVALIGFVITTQPNY